MRLYIDLEKALPQISATGTDQKEGRRAVRSYDESFNRDHTGVMGGDPSKDSAGRHGDDDESLDDDLEEKRKLDSKIAQERGIVAKPVQKALDLLKSFNEGLRADLAVVLPNAREIEYLTIECGYTVEDIAKGYAKIDGYERARFTDWLHKRLKASIERLEHGR